MQGARAGAGQASPGPAGEHGLGPSLAGQEHFMIGPAIDLGQADEDQFMPSQDAWNPFAVARQGRQAPLVDGQADQARVYLNKVRERARYTPKIDPQRVYTVWDSTDLGVNILPDVTTGDQNELRDSIYHEQRVELAQEGHRRCILIRTGRLKEAMERAKGAKGCTVEDHEWLFPLPPEEVTNSFGRIKQNPGY